jgi:hypothetical protein
VVVSLLAQTELGKDDGHGYHGFLRLLLVGFIHDERTLAWEFRDSIKPTSQWKISGANGTIGELWRSIDIKCFFSDISYAHRSKYYLCPALKMKTCRFPMPDFSLLQT